MVRYEMVQKWRWVPGATLIKGWNVAILGPRGSGKTRLHTIMQSARKNCQLPDVGTEAASTSNERMPSKAVKLIRHENDKKSVIHIRMRKTWDFPGEDSRTDEENVYASAHLALYLFDGEKIFSEQYAQEVKNDIDYWNGFNRERTKESAPRKVALPDVYYIATHLDSFSGEDLIHQNRLIRNLSCFAGCNKGNIFGGSLLPEHAAELLYKVLSKFLSRSASRKY